MGAVGTVGTQELKGIGASGALGVPKGVWSHFGGIRGVGVSGVHWGLAGTVGTQGPEGV